jgi:phage terminase Nu1 subunit (DNA packaging protein)
MAKENKPKSGSSFVKQVEYAQLRGVDRSTVTLWKRQGYLVLTEDGRVDVKASDRKLAARPVSYRGGITNRAKGEAGAAAPVISEEEQLSLAEAQRVKEEFLARRAKLAYERESGRLFEIEPAAAMIASEFANIRNAALGLGTSLAPQLILCKTAAEMKAIVDDGVTQLLTDLSNYQGAFDEEYEESEAEHYADKLSKLD